MKDRRLTLTAVVVLALAANPLPAHAAAHAAKVIYAFGQVQASSAAGKGRQLRKGDRVFPGETVATRRGRAQLKFTDGGFASLQPNTEYRLDDYNFSGKADGKERGFFSLIKGSVRLITGLIGRTNRNTFRIKTKVATIGIRGTSGKVSHCDSDCGNQPVGTRLQGYGGVWDLVSGTFSGPVAAGDAYVCDGATCRQMQGGVAQREDVDVFDEFDQEEQQDDGFQQGEQVDRDGILCDLGGNCGDTVVLLNQVVASADQGSPGDTDSEDGVAIVLKGGFPVAGITVLDDDDDIFDPFFFDDDPDIELSTIDFEALRAALNAFPDPEIVAVGNRLLDLVDAATLESLRSMPASVAPEDFGPTTDGILTKGRWTNGFVLDIEADFDDAGIFSEVFIELVKLTGFQSLHFIYGPEPGSIPSGGSARYHFTGGTFSTATDGSSIGLGVTDGMLSWDFGLGSGSLDMTVVHGPMTFDVMGGLRTDGTEFFRDSGIFATFGGTSFPVTLDGAWAGPNGGSAPLAAALAYAIDLSRSFSFDIIGVAGFGLWSSSGIATTTTPVGPVPAASGVYIAASHAFDGGFGTNSNAWDFVVGAGNTATVIDWSVSAFSASTGDFVCTPSCTFDSGSAIQVESGSMASIGVSWVRWGTGHAFTHPGLVSDLGHAHIIKVDAPTPTLPTGMMGTYTLGAGGGTGATTPTWNIGPGGGTFEVATSSTHTLVINFVSGDMSATHNINFPSGSVGLFGAITTPVLATNSINYSGSVTGAVGSCTGCVFGHDHFTFAGTGAGFVVGSGQFNSSGLGTDEVGGAFTFKLPGTLVPYP